MFLSVNSIKNFIFINSFLFILALYQYNFISYYEKMIQINILFEFIFVFFIFIIRNYLLINFIDYGTKNKFKINNDIMNIPREEYKYEFHINVINTTSVECITHLFIKKVIINNLSKNIYYEILYFIPVSFAFEIIFDFFHYFGHRLLHNKLLYKYLHKKHHKFKHPCSITTFYQDPIDLLITNSAPTILSLIILQNTSYISYLQFNFITIYKNFIEISGHSGKKSYPTSSFPQCIWLPKLLDIELYTEDHDLHHSLNNCNYSKRFSLWDKLFNTYKTT
jgi:sterol desaturase/sphingolipid hydroxylase (fatty acid hydroxylase superfamily)